jgi:hypothetical protein
MQKRLVCGTLAVVIFTSIYAEVRRNGAIPDILHA